MAGIGGGELVAVVHTRLGVVGDRRGLGESGQHIQRCDSAPGIEDSRRFGRDPRSKRLEDFQLARQNALVRAEYFVLVLFQRWGDETLAARDRLLANVVN